MDELEPDTVIGVEHDQGHAHRPDGDRRRHQRRQGPGRPATSQVGDHNQAGKHDDHNGEAQVQRPSCAEAPAIVKDVGDAISPDENGPTGKDEWQRSTAHVLDGSPMSTIVNLSDFEDVAVATLAPAAYAYYAGGAADEITLGENRSAWSHWRLRPRVLVDVATITTTTTLLGTPVAMPFGIAPTALHGLAHAEGEVAMARGASDAGLVYTMSSLATRPVEDLVEAGIEGPRWFQVYDHRDRSITADMVARAEAAGCRAIVLTVDLPVFGRREREIRSGFAQPDASGYGNFARYAAAGEVALVTAGLHSSQFTWAELDWLAGLSSLPLVVKGIHTGEDAALACEHGVAGVWVSNHGGRQLDRVQPGAEVIEEVVAAVGGRAEVYVDGGVRRGTDVLVALALGARAVFAGRPWLYALAFDGSDGVGHAAGIIRAELENAMALLGTPTIGDVTRSHVTRS